MKLPVSSPVPRTAARRSGFGVVLFALVCFSSAALVADETPTPAPSVPPPAASPGVQGSPAGEKRAKGAPKMPKPPKPNSPVSKEIPIILPVGEDAFGLKIPELGMAGQILSQLMATKMTRIDADHLQMQGTRLDLNKADGKSDYHIDIPTSIFDVKNRTITSDEPVVIKTEDFELTGEKMRFNTIERSGEFIGKVRMVIHNLKNTAGFAPLQTTKTE